MYSHNHNKRILPRKEDGYRAEFPSHYYSSSSVYSYSPTSTSDCPEHGRSRRRTTLILTTSIVLATLGVLSIAGVAAYLGILSKNINNNASQFEESYLQSNTSKEGGVQENGDFLFNNGRSRSDLQSGEGIDLTNSLLDTKTGLEDPDSDDDLVGVTTTTRRPSFPIIVQRNSSNPTTNSYNNRQSSIPPPVTITSDNSQTMLVQKHPNPRPSVPSPVQVSSDPNVHFYSQGPSSFSTPQTTKVYSSPPSRPVKTPQSNIENQNRHRFPLTNSHSLFPSTTTTQFMYGSSSSHPVDVSTVSALNVDRDRDIANKNANDREKHTRNNANKKDEGDASREDDTESQESTNANRNSQFAQNSFADRKGLVAAAGTDDDEFAHVLQIKNQDDHQNPHPHHKSDATDSTPTFDANNNPFRKHFTMQHPHQSSSDYFIPINPIISSERDDDPTSLLNNHKMHLTFDRISPEFYDKKPWTPLLNRPNLDKRPRVEVINNPTPTIIWNSEEEDSSASSPSPQSPSSQSKPQTYYGYGHTGSASTANTPTTKEKTTETDNESTLHDLATNYPQINKDDKQNSSSTVTSVVTPMDTESEVLITSGGFKPVQIPAYTVLIPHIPNEAHSNANETEEEESAPKEDKEMNKYESEGPDKKLHNNSNNEREFVPVRTTAAALATTKATTKSPAEELGGTRKKTANVTTVTRFQIGQPDKKETQFKAEDIKDEDYTDSDDMFGLSQPQTKIYKLDPESVDIVPDTLGSSAYPPLISSSLTKQQDDNDRNQDANAHQSQSQNERAHQENDTRQTKSDITQEKKLNSSVIAMLTALKKNSTGLIPINGPVEQDMLMKSTTDLIMSTLGSLNLVKSSSSTPNEAELRLRASDIAPEENETEAPLFPPVRSYVGINQPLRPKPHGTNADDADILTSGPSGSANPIRKFRLGGDGMPDLPPDLTTTSSLNKVLSMMMKFDKSEQRGHLGGPFKGPPVVNITKQNVNLVIAGGPVEKETNSTQFSNSNVSQSSTTWPSTAPQTSNSSREQKSFNRDSKIDTQFNPPIVTSHIEVPLVTENSNPNPVKTKLSSVRVNNNSPVYKFILRKGQSVEDLLKEIFNNYTDKANSSEATTIPTKIGIINELTASILSSTTFPSKIESDEDTTTVPEKLSSAIDLKFAFSTVPTTLEPEIKTSMSVVVNENVHECASNNSFQCVSTKRCISGFARCNGLRDCEDNSDEKGCLCVDLLKAQMLHRKICDGIPDCKDFSDENQCEWCSPGQYICSGSRACVSREKICDGKRDCPRGDDESECVKIGQSGVKDDLEDLSPTYHRSGHLMVRKKGVWGKLCVETFSTVVSHWEVKDLARAVCKALTFSDFETVERTEDEVTNSSEPYYELYYGASSNDTGDSEETYSSSESSPRSGLGFKQTACKSKLVVKVTCQDLQCGTAPRAYTQAARIVGGSNAGIGEWPWQAALYRDGEYQCGATLISSRWLLSAGHCFFHSQDDYWVARLGTLRRGATVLSPYEQVVRITHIFLHPQYKDVGFVNDISLLRLEKEVNFTDFVRPVCLPGRDTKIRDGRLCTVVGWGQLFEVGRVFPDTLQEVQLPLISTPECRKRTLFLPLYKLTEDMFCAGFDRGGRDACLGDSGGGMMCSESDGRWSLYGVTSNGYGCARAARPGVYTKVASYLDWIYEKMRLDSSFTFRDKTTPCLGHRCPLGECLEPKRLCNGFSDCLDSSDERNCTWS